MTVILWIICGVLALGLEKNYYRILFSREIELGGSGRWKWQYNKRCILLGLLGPIGLVVASAMAFLMLLFSGYNIGFCYWMPKELCESRKGRLE